VGGASGGVGAASLGSGQVRTRSGQGKVKVDLPGRSVWWGQADGADFTTVQRLDAAIPPSVTGQDAFFEFLFSGSDVKYAELKDKASKVSRSRALTQERALTFNIDAKYQIVRTQYTHNVSA
jgi:hypothetical protein